LKNVNTRFQNQDKKVNSICNSSNCGTINRSHTAITLHGQQQTSTQVNCSSTKLKMLFGHVVMMVFSALVEM
jgi:hypothetical protein